MKHRDVPKPAVLPARVTNSERVEIERARLVDEANAAGADGADLWTIACAMSRESCRIDDTPLNCMRRLIAAHRKGTDQ